jgi:hypothetical protein
VRYTIHFCSVVGGQDLPLLSRLIDHYKYLGVNGRWLIGVHMATPDDPILDRAEQILGQHDIEVALTVVGPWRHRLNPGVIQRTRSLYPSDWAVIADQDEFHVYPDSLSSITEYCEKRGYEGVSGEVIDRIGENGALPRITKGHSLWHTFPLAGDVTKALLATPGGRAFYSPEVVLAKGSAVIGWGNHYIAQGNACPSEEITVPVHHFKWDAEVIHRLRSRHELYTELGEPYGWESEIFINHLREHGRVDITDPRLNVRYVGNPYGDENMLE